MNKWEYQSAQLRGGNMGLPVYAELPEGYWESPAFLYSMANVRTAVKWDRERPIKWMYHCHYCDGWIDGDPLVKQENTMDRQHPLSGRNGEAYICKRCGLELGFFGAVA